jgi:hypothetical protein
MLMLAAGCFQRQLFRRRAQAIAGPDMVDRRWQWRAGSVRTLSVGGLVLPGQHFLVVFELLDQALDLFFDANFRHGPAISWRTSVLSRRTAALARSAFPAAEDDCRSDRNNVVLTTDGVRIPDNQNPRLCDPLGFVQREFPMFDLDFRMTILATRCEAKLRSIVGSPVADPMTVL